MLGFLAHISKVMTVNSVWQQKDPGLRLYGDTQIEISGSNMTAMGELRFSP